MAKVRAVRSVDELISPSIEATAAALDELTAADAAALRLARRYGAAIDDAHQVAAELAALLPDDEDVRAQVAALAARVDAITTLDKLGPKLLASLEALGATPRARAAFKPVAKGAGGGKLAQLRNARTA